MIIILFSILFLLIGSVFFSLKYKISKELLFVFFGIILILVAGFRGEGVDRDYSNYVEMFNENESINVEFAFLLISKIINFFIGPYPVFLFVFFAILGVTLKLVAIKQITELWFLSLVIYFTNFFVLHEMTQIRVGIACAFVLLSVRPIYEKNLKLFLLYATIGFCFHYSALLILPLWFLGHELRKKWLLVCIPIGYFIYFVGINLIGVIPLPGIQEKIELYKQFQELGYVEREVVNVFSLFFLIRVIVFYLILWKYELITLNNKYTPVLIKIYSIGLMSYLIFANMPVFATRISELFFVVEIILIPFFIYVFKPLLFAKSLISFIGVSIFLMFLFYTKLITTGC